MGVVGRDAEVRALREAAGAVRGGGSAVVVVHGEPGIGKSALLAEACEEAAAAGLQVLAARAAEHERDVPFALVREALGPAARALGPARRATLAPEIDAALTVPGASGAGDAAPAGAPAGAAERHRVHRALADLVGLLARERPAALVLDDVHWADAVSREWLLHLLRRPPGSPVLLVLGLRPSAALEALLAETAGRADAVVLGVGPLPRAEALALLGAAPAARREEVAREAAGNPLFLLELARAAANGEDRLPASILAAIGRETGALEPQARALLDAAAVAGDPFDVDLAAAIAGMPRDRALGALDTLAAAGLVQPAGGTSAAFRHPLVRRAVRDALAPGARLAAHDRAARALTARGAGPVAVAHHVERAAVPGDRAAAGLLARAAALSGETSPDAAAHWYASALRVLPETDPGRADLLARRALALAQAGRLPEAGSALGDAIAASDGERRIGLELALAEIEQLRGDWDSAGARLERLREQAPAALQPLVALRLAQLRFTARETEALDRAAGDAVALAGEDPAPRAAALGLAAQAAFLAGRTEESLELTAAAAALARALPAPERARVPEASLYAGLARFDIAEDPREGAALMGLGARAAREAGDRRWPGLLEVLRGLALVELLELDEALATFDEAAERSRLAGARLQEFWALNGRALALHERGDALGAERAAEEAARLDAAPWDVPGIRAALFVLARVSADRDPARIVELARSYDRNVRSGQALVVTRAALAAGRADEAERWARIARRGARGDALPVSAAKAQLAESEVLLAGARPDAGAAAERALAAVAALESLDVASARLDALLTAGRALAAAGRADDAREHLERAAGLAARHGAGRGEAIAAHGLRRLGVRPRTAPRPARAGAGVRADPGALTPREREIAALVARGSANKEVAATLHLSPKTVEANLSRVYAKLGVRSRTELAALAREGGLTS